MDNTPESIEVAPTRIVEPDGRESQPSGIAMLAMIIMAGSVLSRVLGLVREQIAASMFGTGDAIAAFTVADNIQTIIFDLMVSGALQAALIPVLAQWTADTPEDRASFRRVGGTLVLLATLVLGALTIIGVVIAPRIVDVLTWFSGDDGGRNQDTVDLTIRLVRITLPAALLLSVGTLLQAMLYALGRVGAPSFSTALRNFAIVTTALVLGGRIGVESMAWGTVIGASLILLLQVIPLSRAKAIPIPNLDFRHPALRQILVLYMPVFLGLLVSSAAVVVDRGLAWGAGKDALGAMRYATTLVHLILGLVAAAIGLAALPTLSRLFAEHDLAGFQRTLGRALVMVTILIFPATFGLAALGNPVASLLFGYGRTDDSGVRQITIALLGYLPGALAAAYDQVLIYAFYARQNTKIPVAVGVLAVGVYFAVALSLVNAFGMTGLVLANSAQFGFHAIVMYHLARRRFGWTSTVRLNALIPRCALASLGMAIVILGLWRGLDAALPVFDSTGIDVARRVAIVVVPGSIGTAVYLLAIWSMAGTTILEMTASIRGRLLFARR